MQDLERNTLQKVQFGPWLRANLRRVGEGGSRGSGNSVGRQVREMDKEKGPVVSGQEFTHTVDGTKLNSTETTLPDMDYEQLRVRGADLQGNSEEQTPTREVSRSAAPDLLMEPSRAYYHEKEPPQLQEMNWQDNQQTAHGLVSIPPIDCSLSAGSHAPRLPLQDCTNIVRTEGKAPGGEQVRCTRGQWKRRARLQGKEGAQSDLQMHEQLSEALPKRNRHMIDPIQPDQ